MFEMCGSVFESVSIATSSFTKKGPSAVTVLVLLQVELHGTLTCTTVLDTRGSAGQREVCSWLRISSDQERHMI